MQGNPYYEPYNSLTPDELEHYGVLGMKWGVRRYQNKDGTLTAAGKQKAKKERTPEEQAKHDKRVATAKKAAKIAAVGAAVAVGGLSVHALASSAAGKAAIAAGVSAVKSLFDRPPELPNGGNFFTLENGQTVRYTNGVPTTLGQTAVGNIFTENVTTEKTFTENIFKETISTENISSEYLAELASNSRRNRR